MDEFRIDWATVVDIRGLHNEEEMLFLYKEILKLPESSILVEIGTWEGRSAAIMGLAAEKINGRVFTIDYYDHSLNYSLKEQYQSLALTNENLRRKDIKNVLALQSTSGEMAEKWVLPIDLLFVDGDHKYESVKADIESWLPKVKIGGFVMFHDYSSHEGVLPAVDEAINDKKLEKKEQVQSLLKTIKL